MSLHSFGSYRLDIQNNGLRHAYANYNIALFCLQVFSADKERAFEHHILQVSNMLYGVTKLQTRKLSYLFAKTKNISMPANWIENEAAGEDWLSGFRRSGNLSLRNPE